MALRDVKGQDRAAGILLRTLGRGRLPSAYLFAGESGIGKRFAAINLAKAINCVRDRNALFGARDESVENGTKDLDSCDICSACRKIDAGAHPDVSVIAPQKGEIRVDEIRAVEEALSFRPHEGKKKIVIIDDADTMNQSAANAFLKTLEEPPEDSLIILVSSNPDRLPETVRSRCSCVKFTPLSADACREVIRTVFGKQPKKGDNDKRQEFTDHQLSVVVKLSMGRPGLAVSSEVLKDRERFLHLLENMVDGDGEIWAGRDEMEQWLDMALVVLRDMMMLKAMGNAVMLFNEDIGNTLSVMGKRAEIRSIVESYTKINHLRGKLDYNLNKAITWNYTASIVRTVTGCP